MPTPTDAASSPVTTSPDLQSPSTVPTTSPDSQISLATVSAELAFIARYIADYGAGKIAIPKAEKDRIKAALLQSQADLNFVVSNLLSAILGFADPGIGQ